MCRVEPWLPCHGNAFNSWCAGYRGIARNTCLSFSANAVRLQLHALVYNFANFLRTLATADEIGAWSLTSLRERLIKAGAWLVKHARYAVFRMAEAAHFQRPSSRASWD